LAHILFEKRSLAPLALSFPRLRTARFGWNAPILPDALVVALPVFGTLTAVTLRSNQSADVASVLTHLRPRLVSLTLQSFSHAAYAPDSNVTGCVGSCGRMSFVDATRHFPFSFLSADHVRVLDRLELRQLSIGVVDNLALGRLATFSTLEALSVTALKRRVMKPNPDFTLPPLPHLRSLCYRTQHKPVMTMRGWRNSQHT
jgi:hypothetical protein